MEAGDRQLAARVLRRIYFQTRSAGRDARGRARRSNAGIALVEDDPDGREELAELLRVPLRGRDVRRAIRTSRCRWAERALELPRTETVTLMALHLRGNARCETGDLGGVDDLRRGARDRRGVGRRDRHRVRRTPTCSNGSASRTDPSAGLPMNRATVDLCRRRGIEGQGMWTRAEGFWLRFDAGLWDELLDETSDLDASGRPRTATRRSPPWPTSIERGCWPIGATWTPRSSSPSSLRAGRPPDRRSAGARHPRSPSRSSRACRGGRHGAARRPSPKSSTPRPAAVRRSTASSTCPEIVRALLTAGRPDLATSIVGDRPVHVRRTRLAVASSHALLAEARGDVESGRRGLPSSSPRAGKRGVAVSSRRTPWPGWPDRSGRSGETEEATTAATKRRRRSSTTLGVARRG